MLNQIIALINNALMELQGQPGYEAALGQGPETRLYGRQGALDSLGLVSLIVALEQALEDEFQVTVALADEKALSQARSPFRTIRSLAEYAQERVQAEGLHG
jgi:D-alanine--poly(phosphoribitol) ligase subunit 2